MKRVRLIFMGGFVSKYFSETKPSTSSVTQITPNERIQNVGGEAPVVNVLFESFLLQ